MSISRWSTCPARIRRGMNNPYRKTYSALLVAAFLALTACSTAPTAVKTTGTPAPPDVIAQTLHELTKGYSTGDFERFISVFAPGATYQGNAVADKRDAWEAGFTNLQYWQFSKINIYGGNTFVWFTEQSERFCAGPALYRFDSSGLIQSVEAACVQTDPEDELPADFDQALGGQLADIGTTTAGFAAGLVEGNPIVAGMGLPIAGVAKIIMSKYADTLPPQECYSMKTSLSTAGWGAAGFNTCMIAVGVAVGPASLPLCGAVGIISGKVAYAQTKKSNAMRCWKQLDGSDKRYQRISAAGIVEENQ